MIDIRPAAGSDIQDRNTPVLILESTDQAALLARRFAAAFFVEWGISDHYLARLVVSELVTNAHLHGEGAIILRLSAGDGDGLALVEVYDEGERLPTVRPETPEATSGRGMPTIQEVTAAWGVRRVESGGKVVWAKIAH